jgi:hypothetical protein
MFLNQHIAEFHAADLRTAAEGGRRLRTAPRGARPLFAQGFLDAEARRAAGARA